MDTAVRKISIAEQARRAAELAHATLENQHNPLEPGSDDHQQWDIAYRRYFDELVSGEGSA